jgi:hypothetical protein
VADPPTRRPRHRRARGPGPTVGGANQERDQIKAALGTELSKSDKKAVKRYDQIFKAAIQCLERASPDNLATTATAVRTAKELIYTAIAKDVRDVAGGRMTVGGALGVARRFVAQETYYLAHADAGARLEKGPEAEATNLVHPKDPTRFITVDELRNMNVGRSRIWTSPPTTRCGGPRPNDRPSPIPTAPSRPGSTRRSPPSCKRSFRA